MGANLKAEQRLPQCLDKAVSAPDPCIPTRRPIAMPWCAIQGKIAHSCARLTPPSMLVARALFVISNEWARGRKASIGAAGRTWEAHSSIGGLVYLVPM